MSPAPLLQRETRGRQPVIAPHPGGGRTKRGVVVVESVLTEWLNLIVRWLHVVAGIAWIGSSF